jgi:glycosyltransferase involved in cell wall biosynthesis
MATSSSYTTNRDSMRKRILCLIMGSQSGAGMSLLLALIRNSNSLDFVIVTQEKGALTDELDKLGIQYRVVRMRGYRIVRFMFHNFLTIRTLVSIAKLEKIDLIYCVQWRLNPYVVAVSRILKIPGVCHVHDVLKKKGIIGKFKLDKADTVIVPSEAAKKFFVGSSVQVKKIHCGVDLTVFNKNIVSQGVRKEFHIRDKELLIGTVARFTASKGLEDFIIAASRLNEKFKNLRFLIVGDDVWNTGLTRQHLTKYALENKVANLILPGRRDDIPQILLALDIFVLPSHTESFSLALLEAMAMQKPVVATLCGGPQEILEHDVNGLLAPVKEPILLSEAIAGLIEDKNKRQQLAHAAYKTVCEKFALLNYVSGMHDQFALVAHNVD